jgi:hypothetical protein
MLGFIVRIEWEGDQFIYAKPRYADLECLFGIEVPERVRIETDRGRVA